MKLNHVSTFSGKGQIEIYENKKAGPFLTVHFTLQKQSGL